MTNQEYLDYLAHNAPDKLAEWFESEHVDPTEYIVLAQAYKVERDELRESNRAMAITLANIRDTLEDDYR